MSGLFHRCFMMKNIIFPIVLLLFMVSACGPTYILDETYEIDKSAWTYEDSLRFEFTIEDTLQLYDLVLEVKHETSYAFQNLYTKIHTQFPDDQRLSKSVSLELANQVGAWRGDCNAETCTVEIPIQQGAFFNQAGKYVITIEQYMRESPIVGIQSIALKVRDTGTQR